MGKVHRCGVESTAAILRHPLHPMLVPFPIAALVGALAADLVFLFVWSGFWADVASYLVLAGLASGLLAGAVGAVDMLSTPAVRRLAAARVHGLGNVAALGLAAINLWVHSLGLEFHPAWATVLSFITVGLLAGTAWLGGELVYRHHVGVIDRDAPRVDHRTHADPPAPPPPRHPEPLPWTKRAQHNTIPLVTDEVKVRSGGPLRRADAPDGRVGTRAGARPTAAPEEPRPEPVPPAAPPSEAAAERAAAKPVPRASDEVRPAAQVRVRPVAEASGEGADSQRRAYRAEPRAAPLRRERGTPSWTSLSIALTLTAVGASLTQRPRPTQRR